MGIWRATFRDPDGSLSLPEIAAAAHAVVSVGSIGVAIAAFVHSVWVKGQAPDYVAFGTGIAALIAGVSLVVAALGAAQRMRDGQFKPQDGDHQ